MGEVYLAEDTRLHRKVAIKLLLPKSASDEQARKRLIREARTAAQLDHPNICAIHEVADDASFIVMQYIEGETLAATIRTKRLELRESVDIAIQILTALSEAHAHGIIHRDIKPQNIIITPRGQVKVLDFGLAKTFYQKQQVESEAETESILTETGTVVGTIGYMSPEQAKGADLDARSDLFSVGALLYECITGRPAFTGNNLIDICAQVIHVNPPPPSKLNPGVSQEFDGVISQALAKDPNARYKSADDLLEDLRRLRDTTHPGFQIPSAPATAERTTSQIRALATISNILRKRGPSAVVALILTVIAVIGVLVIPRLWRAAPHQPPPAAKQWYDRGTNYLRDGAYYQASKALEQAISIDDKFVLAHARLAEAWSELDYSEKAKDELLRVNALVSDRSSLPQIESLYLKAMMDTVSREFASAIDCYRKIAEQVPKEEKAFAYVDLGRAYEKNEDVTKAIDTYREAIGRDPQYGAAFLRLGILYGRQQDPKRASEAFSTAESLYESMTNLEGLAEVLYQNGRLLNTMDKLADARRLLERALELTQTTNNKSQQIRVILQLSSIYWSQGDTDRAKRLATEVVSLTQVDHMENLAVGGLIDLGNAFFSRGEYTDAESYFKQALEFAQKYKGRRNEARALLSLGSLNIQREHTKEGIPYIEKALTFYQQTGYPKEVSLCLTLLGRANRQLGDYSAALHAFEEQLQLAKRLGDPAQIASSYSSIGTLVGYYQEQYENGLKQFEESYAINETLGAKLSLAYDSMNRANMLWQMGRYEEATTQFDLASSIAARPEASYKQLSALIYTWTARSELSQLHISQAKRLSKQALELAGTQYNDVIIEAKSSLGFAHALSGTAKKGKILCDEAVTKANEIGNPRFLSNALLALAAVTLDAGDSQGAFNTAVDAQRMFARLGKQDSEWRACLIAARASRKLGNESATREYALHATRLLSDLQARFSAQFYATYLKRTDVQRYRTQLAELLPVNH